MLDAEFFVALGFILFVLLLAYLGVHSKLGATLDHRAARIKKEIAEAERFREEAKALLASFEKRKAAAEAEAEAILVQARAEAEMVAKEAHERMTEFVQRRTKQAEEKIATAEAQAMAQVRSAAADAASLAAETVLKDSVRGPYGDTLVTKGIGDVKALFN